MTTRTKIEATYSINGGQDVTRILEVDLDQGKVAQARTEDRIFLLYDAVTAQFIDHGQIALSSARIVA